MSYPSRNKRFATTLLMRELCSVQRVSEKYEWRYVERRCVARCVKHGAHGGPQQSGMAGSRAFLKVRHRTTRCFAAPAKPTVTACYSACMINPMISFPIRRHWSNGTWNFRLRASMPTVATISTDSCSLTPGTMYAHIVEIWMNEGEWG